MKVSSQLKVAIPPLLLSLLTQKAHMFGMKPTQYIRHLVVSDLKQERIPIFQASSQTEKQYQKSLVSEKNNQYVTGFSVKKVLDRI
ncbi:MAG: hypothetical protein HZA34_03155 [Candidatus Pacebacteria bacterium]|nr:hypothetical protein [Candidatus Paceibacterota bacterium]